MTQPLLSRRHHDPRPALPVLEDLRLTLARLHELCGIARRTLALLVAGQVAGPVYWIAPAWGSDPLNPDGMCSLARPESFVFLSPRRPEDLLWSMEEILRSGTVPLVVADLPEPPGLTPVRRLHLAAEAGMATGPCAPLGLILTPGEGGAPGVESRWRLEPRHSPGAARWQLDRLRARTAPQKTWQMAQQDGAMRLTPAAIAA